LNTNYLHFADESSAAHIDHDRFKISFWPLLLRHYHL